LDQKIIFPRLHLFLLGVFCGSARFWRLCFDTVHVCPRFQSPSARRLCSSRISSAMLVRDKRKPFVLIFGFMKLAGMQC
jgi:hypothetical protein